MKKNALIFGLGGLLALGLAFFAVRLGGANGSVQTTPLQDFSAPFVFGRFTVPEDNPMTEEAFQLGRKLFYDPMLSGANETSCASCHEQELGFTDGLPRSVGHDGTELPFNSMALANLLWGPQRFFWDGRRLSLEEQVLEPLLDPLEMNQPLDELGQELRSDREYRQMFRTAYGEVSSENVAKALSTFLRGLVSGNSRYDQYLRGELRLTEDEELGRRLFMAHPDTSVNLRGGNCIDCHSQFLTAGFVEGFDGFMNNGLDTDEDLKDGLFAVTGEHEDKGKFKVPSLRNIAETGPYMHDGRFETLEEVLNHYNHGIKVSETLSPLILEADNVEADVEVGQGLRLEPFEIEAIHAFLLTLSDKEFLTNPRFSNPFKEGEKE